MEKIRVALDTKDRVAAHNSLDHDPFSHHVKEAQEMGAVAELTNVSPHFADSSPPHRIQLQAALDCRDRLAAHGLRLPEEEALWREELEEGVQQALGS